MRPSERAEEILETHIVYPLKDLEAGAKGKIVYLATNDAGRLSRLMSMGALPGISVTMIQKFPSYVFQVGQSQFAVDRNMAEGIYVRLYKSPIEKSRQKLLG